MADKSYESYEMLAKLLNSGRQENIDSVYDALSDVISGEYKKKKQENKDAFASKRNALASNRAKAEKYLDYFMTDKGYNGSGIEADAKLKAGIGYNSDLASLYAAEALADSELDNELSAAKLKNESERNAKKAAADKDYGEMLYKAYDDDRQMEFKRDQLNYQKQSDESDRAFKRDQLDYQKQSDEADRVLKQNQLDYQKQSDEADRAFKQNQLDYQKESDNADRALKQAQQEAQNELDKLKLQNDIEYKKKQLESEEYLKSKEYEVKMLEAQTNAAKAAANTAAQKDEADALNEKLNSYRQLLYQEMKSSFDLTDDINEKQRIYDSVTGVNTERATEIYGETLYKNMIKEFSKALNDAKAKKADADTVQKLYDRFVNAKDEYHYQTYLKLKRELQFGNFPGFNEDQLERAYKAYLKNGQVS